VFFIVNNFFKNYCEILGNLDEIGDLPTKILEDILECNSTFEYEDIKILEKIIYKIVEDVKSLELKKENLNNKIISKKNGLIRLKLLKKNIQRNKTLKKKLINNFFLFSV